MTEPFPARISVILAQTTGEVEAPPAALLETLARDGVEVILVGECADAGEAPKIGRRVVSPERLTLGAAYNLGAAASTAPLLCFVSDQALPDRSAIGAVVSAAADAPAAVLFEPTASWRAFPNQPWADRFRRQVPAPFSPDGAGLCAPTLAVRREAFYAAGGFDEALAEAVLGSDLRCRLSPGIAPRTVLAAWPVSFPFPASVSQARRWLRAESSAAADLGVLHGAKAPNVLSRRGWDRALERSRARHRRAAAGQEDARRGLLTVDALAVAQRGRATAAHLRAPAIWPKDGGPRLSVVVPTFRRPRHLHALLTSLAPQARVAGAEIIVVDDGSDDDAYRDVVQPYADVVAYHRLARNQGRGAATNHAVARATGDWIVFTDDDVRPPADWLAELAALLVRFPALDAVGGACRPLGRERRGLVERFTLDRDNYVPRPYFARGTLKCMITACMAVRASTLAAVGGIDRTLVAGQDHNLTWRLRRAGARIHVTGDWWVAHDQGWSVREMMERMHRYAYWHGRQARLSGEAIDYLFGPPETWVGLLASTPGRLSRSLRMEARSERTLWTRAAYVGLDMLSHLAWGLGGIAGAKAAPGP